MYIKCIERKNNIIEKTGIPAVVGVSTSSGTDISFSEDPKDGDTRKFLEKNCEFKWFTKGIYIISDSKKDTDPNELEIEIQREYKLFGS